MSCDSPTPGHRSGELVPVVCWYWLPLLFREGTRMGALDIHRALPIGGRRLVGPVLPRSLRAALLHARRADGRGAASYTGLQTVTWHLEGEIGHADSLGFETRASRSTRTCCTTWAQPRRSRAQQPVRRPHLVDREIPSARRFFSGETSWRALRRRSATRAATGWRIDGSVTFRRTEDIAWKRGPRAFRPTESRKLSGLHRWRSLRGP